jgi:benzoyl-CoA-dihydrodiol lyase
VLPGTGGLTRVTDKRHVRRDLADYFSTKAEGVGGKKAAAWRLVDEAVPRARWDELVAQRARELAGRSVRPAGAAGIELTPLAKTRTDDEISYSHVAARLDREQGTVEITVSGPDADAPAGIAAAVEEGDAFWTLAMTRELDDLILDLRTNELELGTWVFRTQGDPQRVLAYDQLLLEASGDWLASEIIHYLKRTLKRLDVTSRSLLALIEPGSCFAGSLLELALAADRSFHLSGVFEDFAGEAGHAEGVSSPSQAGDGGRPTGVSPPSRLLAGGSGGSSPRVSTAGGPGGRPPGRAQPAAIIVGPANLGPLPMSNGLTRLQTRYLGDADGLAAVEKRAGEALRADDAELLGLVTFAPDDIDWAEEVRIAIEERASFSPDALTGLEANYRFPGPETLETKIFGRLTAWQNWIFYRPNASGPEGALRRYGTGQRADFDRKRV